MSMTTDMLRECVEDMRDTARNEHVAASRALADAHAHLAAAKLLELNARTVEEEIAALERFQ